MGEQHGIQPVTTANELREVLKEPAKALWDKDIARIDEHARTIIEHSPFFVLATAAADGTCDVSPRGEPAGGVLVLDERTLAIPDRPGNRRADSLRNILENPGVGLLFMVPGMNETLRVNGTATIARDAPFFDRMAVHGKRPRLAIVVEVTELFLHCAKAFLRAGLWQPDTWPARESLPSAGRIAKDHMGTKIPAAVLDAALAAEAKLNRY
ncbi:pyridoxamine 5'-phosphate oxidase family protein [Amycolatopsis sp. CA-230715]|uniref:pyridoxamine 5'-phosphate oxidase family protein n=1 Tax=Amycolatopsis sp. CA-230715 TaxID=2745196 RepID=UPI001C02D4FC|nr:pyridoxamine 5'-phosphate oxidase family protein [Amycolatopsis sp. CA-230715]